MTRMAELPIYIHSVQQVRAMDRYAIEQLGIPGYALMTRAGEAAFATLRSCWPAARQYLIVCGFGNNAGDGYVLARLALSAKLPVQAVALGPPDKLTGDAHRAWQDFTAAGGSTLDWEEGLLEAAELIVDAIFGTGLSRALDEPLCNCVRAINESGKPVFSLDVPSGLDADSGKVMGAAVRAERTLSFVGLKQGFYLAEGPDYTGIVMFDDLEIPPTAPRQIGHVAERLTVDSVRQALPPRRRTTHKTQQGRVLIVGGGIGMGGAMRLAGEACLRTGAGLVTIAAHPENVTGVIGGRPELMSRGITKADELLSLLNAVDVVAIGPGLGRDAWAAELLSTVLNTDLPLVVDADALNLLAERRSVVRGNWILTPHPGEAARLLKLTTKEVQADRLGSARRIVSSYGGVVVLKGAGSLVMSAEASPFICDRGNPGMAAPGMGDVLTGVIAGVLAQSANRRRDLLSAACAAVYVHAAAGDMAAARYGERGLLASDLFSHLPTCVNS